MKKLVIFTLSIIMFFFRNPILANYEKVFYDFNIQDINGDVINLKNFENKAILLVNTASFCGFTKQYEDLQILWEKYNKKGLIVLGVPSNSFNQESKDNNDVKDFCEVNFNIEFPLTTITDVKGKNAHEIFKWAEKNHGKSAIPKWNFYKILINKEEKLKIHITLSLNQLPKNYSDIEKILEIDS